jgi:hypothetical protein
VSSGPRQWLRVSTMAAFGTAFVLGCGIGTAAYAAEPRSHGASGRIQPKSAKGENFAMQQVVPNSRSIVLRSTHIVAFEIVTATPGPWKAQASGGEQRTVSMTVRVTELVKGAVDAGGTAAPRLDVAQTRIEGSWRPAPGVWSNTDVQPGSRLVAFCVSDRRDVSGLLDSPAAIALMPEASVLPDLRTIAPSTKIDLGGLLAKARPQASTLSDLFADYLWARFGGQALRDFAVFEAVVAALEWPELGGAARSALLMTMPDTLLARQPAPLRHIDRLAVAMLRLLDLPTASPIHDNVVSTFLPNLLDADDPGSRPPAAVFAAYPTERARLPQLAGRLAGRSEAAVLVAWLRR